MIDDKMADELIEQFELETAIQQMLIEKGWIVREIATWYHAGDKATSARVYQSRRKNNDRSITEHQIGI